MTLRVAILGDSSSSGIGLGASCYPAKLFAQLRAHGDVAFTNFAVPGCTSADASRFFHAEVAGQPWDYLIIYLGNNEGADSVRRGYWSPLKRLTQWLEPRRPKRFRPVLFPARFRFSHAAAPRTVSVTPDEFRGNLRSIIRRATRKGTQVILINPIANDRFPCGLGTVNAAYLCYLDDLDRLGGAIALDPIDPDSAALAAGAREFAEGRWEAAIAAWQPCVAAASVAGFIARHNVACAYARLGDPRGEAQLHALLGEQPAYDSAVLYNLAQIRRGARDDAGADTLMARALQSDGSVYRIGPAYRAVIAAFASMKRVQVLDLAPLLKPEDFIDYCHPTDAGHAAIASALAALVAAPSAGATPEGSRYRCVLPSPNYMRDPGQSLVEYYCMDWPIDSRRIAALLEPAAGASTDDAELARCLENFHHANGAHPIVTDNLDLRAWAPRSHEILSFPEFFQYRMLHNYAAAYEAAGLAQRLAAGARLEGVRFTAADWARLILRANDAPLETPLDLRPAYRAAVVGKIGARLTAADLLFRPSIGERIRTVMTWYTRESFRYGTQSRLSMLYPRWEIERLLEAVMVALVIVDQAGDAPGLQRLDGLLAALLDLLDTHEHHAGLYHADRGGFSVADYGTALDAVRGRIDAAWTEAAGLAR